MNWNKFILSLVTLWRDALPPCAVFLLALPVLAEIELDKDGLLNVADGSTITLNALALDGLDVTGIVIEEGGMLKIENDTSLYLKGVKDLDLDFDISVNKGTLHLLTSEGTTIYSGELDEENFPKNPTPLSIAGGLIKITEGNSTELMTGLTIVFNAEGGMIDVGSGLTFESGGIYQYEQSQQGEGLTKTGKGTWRVSTASLGTETLNVLEGTLEILGSASIKMLNVGQLERNEETGDVISTISTGAASFSGNATIGTLNLESGTVNFFQDAGIGTLNSKANTVISGAYTYFKEADEENEGGFVTRESNLTISNGGIIEGKLEDIGTLLLTGGTLTFEGNPHSVEKIGIAKNATMNVKTGTSIQLTSDDAQSYFDDIIIEGTLKVSSGFGTGIYKGDLASLEFDDVYITVVGSTNSDGEVTGGIVEIYKSDPESGIPEVLTADTLHTQVVGIGQIIVESGVTFQSGGITFGNGGQTYISGAHILVSGGGTYKAGEIDLGTGYLMLEGDGTAMEFLDTVSAGAIISSKNTHVLAHDDAVFGTINLAGDYDGGGHNLTIQKGGRVAGHILNVDEFTLGGNLLLAVEPDTPTISVKTWTLSEPNTTQVRVVGGTIGGTYRNAIQVEDEASRQELLAVLQSSKTALYHPMWTENGTSLDLQLSILTLNDYIYGEWGRSGRNIENVAALLGDISTRYPELRERLEGLSDRELRNVLRRAMAGELVGNAARFALQQPAYTVFRHLDHVAPLRSPFARRTARGQVREGCNVWFNAFGQGEQAEKDGTTFDDYTMSRYGFHLGGDIEIYRQAVAGVLFGYASPYVKSDLGRISANDYTAGLYLRMPLDNELFLNAMAGFGNQDYSYKSGTSDSNFRGNSFFANLELLRPFSFSGYKMTPLVAVDFQSVEMDDFSIYDPIIDVNLRVAPGKLSSTAVRAGLLGEIWRFRTRVQYMRQIAGDDFILSRTTVMGDELAAAARVRGTQWGKDWLNAGIGGELLSTQHWQIFADYNFDLGRRTTSHLGSLNTVLRW